MCYVCMCVLAYQMDAPWVLDVRIEIAGNNAAHTGGHSCEQAGS